ncbi:MAG: UDP-N-acetylglucosamine 2-epimerase (non-hydrolyzing) [Burkholderiales bacterium]|nr:UDP-N-acetylglucosamine 2-epimerase (non-hydrolyzing) [Burkholderiales bacterium]
MDQCTVMTVVGARPQFVKAAMLSRALQGAGAREFLVHTGQHYARSMSDVFFEELEIRPPDANLGIGSMSHGAQTGRMMEAIEALVLEHRPGWVVVFGDTNSTLAAALVAAKLHVPVAHVEAGLRSGDRRMPEELNRIVSDHVSSLLFAPTQAAVDNLVREGTPAGRIELVGDVMLDAVKHYASRAPDPSATLEDCGLKPRGFVLATVHRAENTDDAQRLRTIVEALEELGEAMPVLLPLHPRTRAAMIREGLLPAKRRGLHLVEPVGYLEMLALQKASALVVTDSGGVQKEAFMLDVPCVTLRSTTEWTELVDCGWNVLLPPEVLGERLGQRLAEALGREPPPKPASPLYGNGDAARRIVDALFAG